MLNYRSKPSKDSIFIEIAIWGADLVLCSTPEFGPHPGGIYGGQEGLLFYVLLCTLVIHKDGIIESFCGLWGPLPKYNRSP